MSPSPSVSTGTGLPSQRVLFTLFGVPWKLTPKSWLFIPSRLSFCTLVALLFLQGENITVRILFGIVFAALLILTQFLHIVGHTLGARYVDAPMDANLILDTRILTHYVNDPPYLPRRVHLFRALGGPIVNTVVGTLASIAWLIAGGPVLLFFAAVNLLLGIGILLPVPGVDGEVVWRELRRK